MFSKLSERMKSALLFAIGMACFLLAGSFVYFFQKSQFMDQGTINSNSDQSSSIQELYQNLAEKTSDNRASMVKEIGQHNSQFESKKQSEIDEMWVLYVTGSVRNPGIYRLPEGARVFELVDVAGGLTMAADAVAINMASILQDGDHLHVPQKGDDDSVRNRNRSSTGENLGTVIFTQDGQRDNVTVRNQRSNNSKSPKIDINNASATELQILPGIGPSMSTRIIQYRSQNGRFKQIAELIKVPGIGAKKLEVIEPFVFVR